MRPGVVLVVSLVAAGGCSFDATGAGGDGHAATTTTSAGPTGTTGPIGSTATTAEATTTTDPDPDPDPTTTADASSSDASSSTDPDGSTTAALPPGEYTVAATLATCVLLPDSGAPYAGPAVCSANATAQNHSGLSDLMMVDTEVQNLDGEDRPAHAYIRFDVPADLAGLTVVAATLHVQVADGPDDNAGGDQSGALVLTAPFDATSLLSGEPAAVQPLVDDLGDVQTNQDVAWSLPVQLVVPGQPLFLGLLPTRTDGVFYRGTTTPGAPTLALVMQ